MKKRLLSITPDFSESGAPLSLYGVLRLLADGEHEIHVIAGRDGEMGSRYRELLGSECVRIINDFTVTDAFREDMIRDWDAVFLNTAVVYPYAGFYQNTDIPVYWWIHEAPTVIRKYYRGFPDPGNLSDNFRLFASSDGSADSFRKYFGFERIETLAPPMWENKLDLRDDPFDLPGDRVIFLIPSAYTYIKGQDILAEAIAGLTENEREASLFLFCGNTFEGQIEFRRDLEKIASLLGNMILLDVMPQTVVHQLMKRCDCVIAPSRVDTIPLTIVEALMFEKTVIVSDQTGISYSLKDCENGFVFKDIKELTDRLRLIIHDHASMGKIAEKGHGVYTSIFSPEAVRSRLVEIGL